MYITVYYKNGIIEEFTLGMKSAKNLISRLIQSKTVNKIISFDKVIYEEIKPDSTKEINRLKRLLNEAEFWYNASELDILDGSYFPVDPTKKKMPESIRKHNQVVKRGNFFSTKEKIIDIEKEFLNIFRSIGHKMSKSERKEVMLYRKRIKELIKSCNSYIELLA